VQTNVDLETASARVALVAAAEGADKRLLTGVRIFVRLQVALGYKAVVANFASERSLAGVRPHVSLQVSGLGELLKTALVRTKKYFGFIFGPRNLFNEFYVETSK